MTDVYDALRQVKDILDDIDLPPRALNGQEDYDTIMAIVKRRCPTQGECDKCAFDSPGDEDCQQVAIQEMLAKMRGRRS